MSLTTDKINMYTRCSIQKRTHGNRKKTVPSGFKNYQTVRLSLPGYRVFYPFRTILLYAILIVIRYLAGALHIHEYFFEFEIRFPAYWDNNL